MFLFLLSVHEVTDNYNLWSCQNICEALTYLSGNILIRVGSKFYRRKIVNIRMDLYIGIPMGTTCAPLIPDLFLFCYERDFMLSLSVVKDAEIIQALKSTSIYLDDILNVDNLYFEGMAVRIYPLDLQLHKAHASYTEDKLLLLTFIYFKRICFIQKL